MDITYIDNNTWKELKERHPAAYRLLSHNALLNEYKYLKKIVDNGFEFIDDPRRAAWIKDRYNGLKSLYEQEA
jgi:hypothetical protein